ncbi:MAG: diaminopimelate dehydrogenase [Clostridia bacterium]|nr:diaminopimelate dehydrogenase [Clostridia bacterium]
MKIAVVGYGNLGKSAVKIVKNTPDTELFGVFSRRKLPDTLPFDDILKHKNDIDVLILCGGSATDLPRMTPYLAEHFNVVDSFDTHADIAKHYENVGKSAEKGGKTAFISCGWDPGIFSLARICFNAILPDGRTKTYWGKGVSQGHSDAIRQIDGVIDARQYTIPVYDYKGENPHKMHRRECFVVVENEADKDEIEGKIKAMPNYFAGYDTSVHFVGLDELKNNHSGFTHGGRVVSDNGASAMELRLKMASNPDFTAGILVACARTAYRMNREDKIGAFTMADVPMRYLARGNIFEMM